MGSCIQTKKTHYLTLSFDDGFKSSFYKTAEIFENYGLKACLNVIASGHFPDFKKIDQWILPDLLGDFDDWNFLKNRGHEVMPHTWEHLNLPKIPLNHAKENIDKCLDYFEEHLEDYKPSESVYNFAFNASTPVIEDYVMRRTRAIRTKGGVIINNSRFNEIPSSNKQARLGCWGNGPNLCDTYVEQEINGFLKSTGGWLIINLHGLDNEGWGPISAKYLDELLKRLIQVPHLEIAPTGTILKNVQVG